MLQRTRLLFCHLMFVFILHEEKILIKLFVCFAFLRYFPSFNCVKSSFEAYKQEVCHVRLSGKGMPCCAAIWWTVWNSRCALIHVQYVPNNLDC